MSDHIDPAHAHHPLLQGQRHGEQQLVILAAVERRHDGIGMNLLGESRRLTGDRDPVEVNAGSAFRGFTNLEAGSLAKPSERSIIDVGTIFSSANSSTISLRATGLR